MTIFNILHVTASARFLCYIIYASFVHCGSFLVDPYFYAHLLVDFAITDRFFEGLKWARKRDPRQLTTNKLTANNADWLRRAILNILYYPQSHLAQTLPLWQNHCNKISDKIAVMKPLVCGQFVAISLLGLKKKSWSDAHRARIVPLHGQSLI